MLSLILEVLYCLTLEHRHFLNSLYIFFLKREIYVKLCMIRYIINTVINVSSSNYIMIDNNPSSEIAIFDSNNPINFNTCKHVGFCLFSVNEQKGLV